MSFYAVKKGNQIGVFDNWSDCQNATKGFSNPDFKKFNTQEEAENYLNGIDSWAEKVANDNNNGYLVAFTDGSFDEKLNRYSYGVVLIKPDGTEENICSYGNNEKYVDSRNIIGEIFGVINALDWAVSNDYEKIKIYHDYEGLSKWITGEWTANASVSKMFVKIFREKYEGLLHVEFEKVPGHSNVSYNEKADNLAKSALVERKKVAIQGVNWFSISHFSLDDFRAFSDIVIEGDSSISVTEDDRDDKIIVRFNRNSDSVTVTLFKTGNKKLLVQGKNTYLFQVIVTTIVELDDNSAVEQILGSAYRISIKKDVIDKSIEPIENGLPNDYPENLKRLIKQSIINLNYYIDAEDYSQYAFPAFRALEGHIKYLIIKAGGPASNPFGSFNRNSKTDPYFYTGVTSSSTIKEKIETCYNYYKSQRDTTFHFGEILGTTDSTRIISSKEEADELINKCLSLINEQQ